MGRKLPWASSNGSILATKRPIKREKTENEPAIKIEAANKSESYLETPRKPKRPRDGCTPSTSPPAPPEIVFMREGIDGDDVYMMVEDEFQTVAQTFTAHLHMAEYQRLKQEAKTRQSGKSTVVPGNASFEVKYKHARKDLETRQESTLKNIKGVEAEQIEKEVVEPWAGTSLAGLMKWDGGQKTSLKRLDKLSSGSRAAQRLGPSSERDTQSQGTQHTVGTQPSRRIEGGESIVQIQKRDVAAGHERKSQIPYTQQENKPKQSIADTQDDDIPHRNGRQQSFTRDDTNRPKQTASSVRSHYANGRSQAEKPKYQLSTTQSTGTRSRLRAEKKPSSFLDDLDDFDEALLLRSQVEEQETSKSKPRSQSLVKSEPSSRSNTESRATKSHTRSGDNSTNSTAESKSKQDRKSRYDEIPVFLY